MVIEKHVGKTVLLNITEEFTSTNDSIIQSGVKTRLFYANIVDFDNYGYGAGEPFEVAADAASQGLHSRSLQSAQIAFGDTVPFRDTPLWPPVHRL